MYFKTYKEDPADAELISHKLLVRAGYIKKQSAGLYTYLPLGVKVLHKLTNIVREEMNAAGANELLLPMLLPEEVYEKRLKIFGASMFRLKDRNGKGMCLGPTHEELFTEIVRDSLNSYKNFPLNLYQIQTKFRDEVRPRYGLQRAREFLMKDAYSFDTNLAGLDKSFDIMKQAYTKLFNRLGLDYVVVEADNGAIGGIGSNEFMVKSSVGEDFIAVCNMCGYAANIEKAVCVYDNVKLNEPKAKQLVHTPNQKTIEEVASYLNAKTCDLVKAVIYSYDNGIVIVYLRGDREVEEVKLVNLLKTVKLELAQAHEIVHENIVPGFVGPSNFGGVKVVIDNEVKTMSNFISGGNKLDYHMLNTNIADFAGDITYADIRKIVHGDKCPVSGCNGHVEIIKGIEVGHIFKLGDYYTKMLNAKYLDENGKEQYLQMGCYGIGVSRTLAAIVEQLSDERGIVLPTEIAPYEAVIVVANQKDEVQSSFAQKVYEGLKNKFEVLLDDRKESFGVKLKDAELIGVPYIIVVGKQAQEKLVELKTRKTNETMVLNVTDLKKNLCNNKIK